jgi:hypothetical protein
MAFKRSWLVFCLGAAALVAKHVGAAEVNLVRFLVQPNFSPPPCESIAGWYSQTNFHNSTDTSLTVQFLGVSNGNPAPDPKALTVPAHQTVEVDGRDAGLGWNPVPGTLLWVNRLEVPAGVIVANRVSSTVYDVSSNTPGLPCVPAVTNYSGLPLPVVGTLISAGITQYFLGTDLGSEGGGQRIRDSRPECRRL